MSYEDQENHQLFDVRFKATNEQANDVWIFLSCTQEWREYESINIRLNYGNWHMTSAICRDEMCRLADRAAKLRSDLSIQVRKLAQAKGLEA